MQIDFNLEDSLSFSELEHKIWSEDKNVSLHQSKSTEEINEKYDRGEQRIVTESNRERLPNFVSSLEDKEYMDVRPFYQRRSRWSDIAQSKLIESFIMNVPVPPIFLYERDYNSYEVMDGQQRITAVRDFYKNKFELRGLDLWPELNGMKYSDLPSKVKAGIDRRSISSIVLLKESAPDDEESMFIRQLVFERLNTGGEKLEHQEIRNCLYRGPFNDALFVMARNNSFRKAWSIPLYSPDEEDYNISLPVHEYQFYKRMSDIEMVLRFLALRHVQHYAKGMRPFLDLYMLRMAQSSKSDIETLTHIFNETVDLAYEIYGTATFKPYDPHKKEWAKTPSKAFYDAVMIGLSSLIDKKSTLIANKELIIEETKNLFAMNVDGELTGRKNSKSDIINRISLYKEMVSGAL